MNRRRLRIGERLVPVSERGPRPSTMATWRCQNARCGEWPKPGRPDAHVCHCGTPRGEGRATHPPMYVFPGRARLHAGGHGPAQS